MKVKEKWLQKNGLYKCPECGIEKSKKGISSHIIFKHKKKRESNLKEYNKNLKGKTLEERYGFLVAKKMKDDLSSLKKGKPGKKHTKESIEKISKSLLGNQRSKGRGKGSYYKEYWLRSSWETKVAEYLDRNNIIWKYEVQCFKLNDNQTYRPDFFIYDNEKLVKIIEVKGYWYKNNKEKFENFKKKFDITIELWDKEKLKKLNLI